MMEALGQFTLLAEQWKDCEQAMAYVRRQLEIEPWQEGAHQAAMRVLEQSG
jgi:DNA-binding SARP family transcriptional activator